MAQVWENTVTSNFFLLGTWGLKKRHWKSPVPTEQPPGRRASERREPEKRNPYCLPSLKTQSLSENSSRRKSRFRQRPWEDRVSILPPKGSQNAVFPKKSANRC